MSNMPDKQKEIIDLAETIIADFELKRTTYQNIFLKCLRLCRLIGNEVGILLFKFETSGYPRSDDNHMTQEAWNISAYAGRHYFATTDGKTNEYMNSELVGDLEKTNEATELFLKASQDPNISISSANPYQIVSAPPGNKAERLSAYQKINANNQMITKVVGYLYDFMLNIRNSLVYGVFVESTFEKYKADVDNKLALICPESIKRLASAYENISSDNEQNWNNSIHACRRILEDLADRLYPPRDSIFEKDKVIKLAKDNYKNRLLQYLKENKRSNSFYSVVSSSLEKTWDELSSIYDLTNKGTHSDLSRQDAIRYLIHVYLLVSDILSI